MGRLSNLASVSMESISDPEVFLSLLCGSRYIRMHFLSFGNSPAGNFSIVMFSIWIFVFDVYAFLVNCDICAVFTLFFLGMCLY